MRRLIDDIHRGQTLTDTIPDSESGLVGPCGWHSLSFHAKCHLLSQIVVCTEEGDPRGSAARAWCAKLDKALRAAGAELCPAIVRDMDALSYLDLQDVVTDSLVRLAESPTARNIADARDAMVTWANREPMS